jgi:hypothetical protein
MNTRQSATPNQRCTKIADRFSQLATEIATLIGDRGQHQEALQLKNF